MTKASIMTMDGHPISARTGDEGRLGLYHRDPKVGRSFQFYYDKDTVSPQFPSPGIAMWISHVEELDSYTSIITDWEGRKFKLYNYEAAGLAK